MFSSNTSQVSAVTQAEAIDYDGTNDYLSRASDLTGNTNTSTITFSTWVWVNEAPASADQIISIAAGNFEVTINSSLQVQVVGFNGTAKLNATATTLVPLKTWCSIVMSFDMTDTSKRAIYINDVASSVTWTTYVSSTLATVGTPHRVAGISTQIYMGRLSNVYLDYTYRDLSIEANRRLFVTADLKPALGQAALNPIMYLPMSDPTAPGLNQGTGGNFTLTGVVARSGRGPNQYNAPYSALAAGSSRHLNRAANLTGVADGKTFTFNCCFSLDNKSGSQGSIFYILTSTTARFFIRQNLGGSFQIAGYNSSGTQILSASVTSPSAAELTNDRNYVLTISIDLANTSNRFIYVNGTLSTVTWSIYTNDNIDFNVASTPDVQVGNDGASNFFRGKLGAVWFNTSYIDLSVPANLAKFVTGTGINAAPVDLGATGQLPTGTSPLVYLPMYGNDAGRNYGTGGDFTVNSGPFPGARGPNEFWGNKANIATGSNGLRRTSAVAAVNSGTFSLSCYFLMPSFGSNYRLFSIQTASQFRLDIYSDSSTYSGEIFIVAKNSAGTTVLSAATVTAVSFGQQNYLQLCVDLSDTSKRFAYINGVVSTVNWTTYTNSTIETSAQYVGVGCTASGGGVSSPVGGNLSEFYFTTDYIDFSQEANRLKFRDAFGNPVNLTQQIEALAIPNPAIYMRFPPTSFGTNSGTGGDFTVNGTITDGGQL
jgi:hypothetical protein